MYVGLDLGTLQSCFVTKFDQTGLEDIPESLCPQWSATLRTGSFPVYCPETPRCWKGTIRRSRTRLHLRLVNPAQGCVVSGVEAARSFGTTCVAKLTLRERERSSRVIGIPAVADGEAKENLKKAAKGL